MWLKRRYDSLKKSFHWRYSSEGRASVLLRAAKNIYKTINELELSHIAEDPQVNYWLDSYRNHIAQHVTYYKRSRYLPKFISKKSSPANWYSYVKSFPEYTQQEGIISLNGIKLVKPRKQEEAFSADIILEVLFQHLMKFSWEDIQKINYNFYCAVAEGPYEYGSVYLEPGDFVIDAGACIGDFSVLAAFKGAIPYAFEPSSFIRECYLQKNLEYSNNPIIIAPFALSNKRKTFEFTSVIEDSIGASAISKSSDIKLKDRNVKIETIQAIDLDSYVNENSLPRVDFIKADIEGAEREMLQGAQGVLKEFAPKLSLCTYHLPHDPEVMRDLILQANPNYIFEQKTAKLYAYVPGRTQNNYRF